MKVMDMNELTMNNIGWANVKEKKPKHATKTQETYSIEKKNKSLSNLTNRFSTSHSIDRN